MNVLFVRPNTIGNRSIPIGISVIQAILKKNKHKVKIFDTTFMTNKDVEIKKKQEDLGFFKPADLSKYTKITGCNIENELFKTISDFKPDLICFSIMTNDYESASKIAATIKKIHLNIPIIFGGIHPTVDPENTIKNESIDMICVSEGEETLVELLEKMNKKEDITKIHNIWIKKNGKVFRNPIRKFVELEALPPPDCTGYSQMHLYRPFHGKIYRIMDVETSRGCMFACTECVNVQLQKMSKGKGKYHREKSVEKAISDLKYLKIKYGVEMFRFVDEIMFVWSVDKCKDFFGLYKKEVDLPFICFGRAEFVTEEKVKLFRDAGCVSVSFGIETGNPEFRKRILNRSMVNEQIIKAFDLCHKYKIRTAGYQLIALPEEKREYIFDSIELARKCKCLSMIAFVYPFPGTPLREFCLKKGYIDENCKVVDYAEDTIIRNPYMSKARQIGLYKTFVLYTLVPKYMYPIIRICEYGNPFSYYLRNKLIKIYRDKFFERYDKYYPPVPEKREISNLKYPPLGDFV